MITTRYFLLFLLLGASVGGEEKAPGERLLWSFETEGLVRSSPAVGSDGTIYVGSTDHKVYALDAKTGKKQWEFATGGDVLSSPALGPDDTVYVGSEDKKLYALDLSTGKVRWAFETKGKIDSSPVIGKNGILYVGSSDKKVYALRCDSSGLAPSAWPCFGQNSIRSRHLDFSRIKFPFLNLGD